MVKSLVDDIISPPLGIALGQASLDNLFVVIKDGKNATEHYMTLEQGIPDYEEKVNGRQIYQRSAAEGYTTALRKPNIPWLYDFLTD